MEVAYMPPILDIGPAAHPVGALSHKQQDTTVNGIWYNITVLYQAFSVGAVCKSKWVWYKLS